MRGQGFGFVAPLLVLMFVAFNAPIVYMLGLAFWDKGRGFTLEHYAGLLEAPGLSQGAGQYDAHCPDRHPG